MLSLVGESNTEELKPVISPSSLRLSLTITESTTEELKQANSNRYRYDDNREYESKTEELKPMKSFNLNVSSTST